MAITFDNTLLLTHCYFYDNSAGTWTARSLTAAADLFPDDAEVGDSIWFGHELYAWHDLSITVGTALAATSITTVWEWYGGTYPYSWNTLTCVDGTNSFQNTGTNTVSFALPDGWGPVATTPASTQRWYIRCRITALNTLTEGGATTGNKEGKDWSITCDNGSYRMSDLLAADVAGSWGVVTNVSKYYRVLSNITVGLGKNTTSLTVRNAEVLEVGYSLDKNTSPTTKWRTVTVNKNGTFQLGYSSSGAASECATWILWAATTRKYNYWAGKFICYNSLFCKFNGSYAHPSWSGTVDIKNAIMSSTDVISFGTSTAGTINNLAVALPVANHFYFYSSNVDFTGGVIESGIGVLMGYTSGTVENIDFGSALQLRTGNTGMTATAKNCTFSDYSTQLVTTNTGNSSKIYYTLSLDIRDKTGTVLSDAIVKIVDNQGNTLWNGVWTGDLDVFTYWRYQVSFSPAVVSITDYCPLTITITNPGYQTYKSSLYLTNDNRAQEIFLQPALGYGFA